MTETKQLIPEPTGKERLIELAEKNNTTVENIVKWVVAAMKDDVDFAKLQVKAMEKLKDQQRHQFLLLDEQNRQMEARIKNHELHQELERIFPTKEIPQPDAPKIDVVKPTIIMPGQ